MRTGIEMLESRRLLSTSVTETEPNNTRAKADAITRDLDHTIAITGEISSAGDRDWYKLQLQKGDVLGAATTALGVLDSHLRLVNSAGDLLFALDDSSQSGSKGLPVESPLPRTRGSDLDAELWYVITVPGTYYIEVTGSASAEPGAEVGGYDFDVRVARPGMESKPVGAHQILFLDFDGAKVDLSTFPTSGLPKGAKLSPLSSFLGSWGMSSADGDAIIDGVVARMTRLLSQDVRAQGLNGDYDSTHRPGDFDIEICNSRDDRDTWGKDPLISRIVIGGTAEETGFVGDLAIVIGTAETIDYGNFKTSDQAVASLGWIAGGINAGLAAAPPFTLVDVVAQGIAVLAAHEAGHIFGCSHTDQPDAEFFGGTPNVMDPGSAKSFIGPDFIFGTADDSDPRFGVDKYSAAEGLLGIEDTLNHVAFGLSTGKGVAAESASFSAVRIGRSGSLFGTASANTPHAFDALNGEENEPPVL